MTTQDDIKDVSSIRVCEKPRRCNSPNPQVPRVEIELIAELLAVLMAAPIPVSTSGAPIGDQ